MAELENKCCGNCDNAIINDGNFSHCYCDGRNMGFNGYCSWWKEKPTPDPIKLKFDHVYTKIFYVYDDGKEFLYPSNDKAECAFNNDDGYIYYEVAFPSSSGHKPLELLWLGRESLIQELIERGIPYKE